MAQEPPPPLTGLGRVRKIFTGLNCCIGRDPSPEPVMTTTRVASIPPVDLPTSTAQQDPSESHGIASPDAEGSVVSTELPALKRALRAVEDVSKAFPTMEKAVAEFLVVLNYINGVKGAEKELGDAVEVLGRFVGIMEFQKTNSDGAGGWPDGLIQKMAATIKAQADNLGRVLQEGDTGYVVEAEHVIQTIVQALRSISDLIEISTDMVVDSRRILERIGIVVKNRNGSDRASSIPSSNHPPPPTSALASEQTMNRYEQILPSAVRSHSSSDSRSTLARLKEFAISPGLPALKTVVTMVKEVSDMFPPLKTATKILLIVLERIDKVHGAKEELSDAARTLSIVFDIVESHKRMNESQHYQLNSLEICIKRISDTIETQANEIDRLLHRGISRRIIEAEDDVRTIARALRTISNIIDVLTLDVVMDTRRTLQNIQSGVKQLTDDADFRKLKDIPNISPCLPGTRTDILLDLLEWARSDDASHIFWLTGGVGTGKSTVAASFVRLLHRHRLLGGWYFCSRDQKREEVTLIIPSLAEYLASIWPAYAHTLRNIEKEPVLDLTAQFKVLLSEPITAASDSASAPTLIFIIDALDECSNANTTETMLRLLLANAPGLRVKFFVTSRPERHIQDILSTDYPRILRLHEVKREHVNSDIELYLLTKLTDLARDRNELRSLVDWPSKSQIETLTQRANGLFIYVSTAVKHVSDHRGNPKRRLEELTHPTTSASAFWIRDIDGMYRFILTEALSTLDPSSEEYSNVLRCLAAVVCVAENLPLPTIASLLRLDPSEVRVALAGVHSLVYVPLDDYGRLTTFHASFADYLTDEKRSGGEPWFINVPETQLELARGCLDIMSSRLHFNVAGAETSSVPHQEQILNIIFDDVSYASRLWHDHVIASSQDLDSDLWPLLETVLRSKFLYWVEILSVLGLITSSPARIQKLINTGKVSENMPGFLLFLRNAISFLTNFNQPISQCVSHIYISALPLSPSNSQITQLYQKHIPKTITCHAELVETTKGEAMTIVLHEVVSSICISPDGTKVGSGSVNGTVQIWDAESGEEVSKPFEGHTSAVSSVTFSPDGKRIVSGSWDRTIRIWDVEGGREVSKPYEGHTNIVTSIAFSPDGTRIVSGSYDQTIRVWAVDSGKEVSKPCKGHTGEVSSVAFSPDGTKIVSGSYDETIRVWAIESGNLKEVSQPFKGHTGEVSSVAWSPDGTKIVSGSYDQTILVWDVESSKVSKACEGHTDCVTSVTFSPDCTKIISGSNDKTIRVWDVDSSKEVSKACEGHTDWVSSVACSPDGTSIVSGSKDKTIRVWDIKSGKEMLKPCEGHTNIVTFIAFSPDGTKIISGSYDKTIRVWDVESGKEVSKPFKGHTNTVTSVAFSPDGTKMVSGSNDKTIRVWTIENAEVVSKPFEGHTNTVTSVAFSPDGTKIISGSYDKTIRVWDVESGKEVSKPFKGHTNNVTSVAFSPDGAKIVSGSYDQKIRVWNIDSAEEEFKPFEGHTSVVSSVAFSPDGTKIVSGSYDKTIRVWDVESGEEVSEPLKGHNDWVRSIAFSPDGANVVSGSDDQTIRVWDIENGEEVSKPLEGHTNIVTSVAFSPDGTKIVSGSADKTIRVWDAIFKVNTDVHSPLLDAKWNPYGWSEMAGWIIGPNEELLIWVPPQLRENLHWPRCQAILGREQIYIDFTDFKYGASWTDCFCPPGP